MTSSLTATDPLLSDGTPFSELIDTEFREVSMRVLSDSDVYKLELDRVFARSWVVVGHESEIPEAGDFVLRYVGEDQVIVSRSGDGTLNVMLNVCPHRGAKVCRFESGTATQFQCPYHGWTFTREGTFVGTPLAKEQMHGSLRPKAALGLTQARVDTYVGMIFSTFDTTAPSLDEFLGPLRWYLDLMFHVGERPMTPIGPPQRFLIPSNWKCAAEQAAGDVFHGMNLHRSQFELAMLSATAGDPTAGGLRMPPAEMLEATTRGVTFTSGGHFVHAFDSMSARQMLGAPAETPAIDVLRAMPLPGTSPRTATGIEARMRAEDLNVLADVRPTVGNIFPNVQMFAFFPHTVSWRVYVPRGPEVFEHFNWIFADPDLSVDERDEVRRATSMSFGTSGMTESDDSDTWPAQTKNSQGAMGRRQSLRYQAFVGEPNGPQDWPGPGPVYSGTTKDDSQWNWWLRYSEFMTGRPW